MKSSSEAVPCDLVCGDYLELIVYTFCKHGCDHPSTENMIYRRIGRSADALLQSKDRLFKIGKCLFQCFLALANLSIEATRQAFDDSKPSMTLSDVSRASLAMSGRVLSH